LKGVLLYGPKGSGKRMVVNKIGRKSKGVFIEFPIKEVEEGKWEYGKLIKNVI